jgi:hypothetical protein
MIKDPRRNQRFCRRPRDCRQLAGYERSPAFRRAHPRDENAAPAGAAILDEKGAGPARAAILAEQGASETFSSLAVIAPARSGRSSETALMIGILIESMPAPGSTWERAARAQWLAVLEHTLDALYPQGAAQ